LNFYGKKKIPLHFLLLALLDDKSEVGYMGLFIDARVSRKCEKEKTTNESLEGQEKKNKC
jgi:hypothetical protein